MVKRAFDQASIEDAPSVNVHEDDNLPEERLQAQHPSSRQAIGSPKSNRPTTMRCQLPPHCTLSFTSREEFESHYAKDHVNRCSQCQKNLPSEHFLELHILENHDALVEARRARDEKTVCMKFCGGERKLVMASFVPVL